MSNNSISVGNFAKSIVLSGYEALGANSRKLKGAIEKLGYDAVAKISEQESEIDKAIEIGGEEGLIIKDQGAAVNAFTAIFGQLHGVTPEEISSFSRGLDHYLTQGTPDNVITREVDSQITQASQRSFLNPAMQADMEALIANHKQRVGDVKIEVGDVASNKLTRQGTYFKPEQKDS